MFCLASISGIDVLCVHGSLVFFSIWKYSRRLRCHQVFELVIRVNVVTLPVLQRQKFWNSCLYIFSFCDFVTIWYKDNRLIIHLHPSITEWCIFRIYAKFKKVTTCATISRFRAITRRSLVVQSGKKNQIVSLRYIITNNCFFLFWELHGITNTLIFPVQELEPDSKV